MFAVLFTLPVFGLLGLLASVYAIYAERQSLNHKKALCDFNEHMSCGVVLTSKYARMTKLAFGLRANNPLNLPNTYYGAMFYAAIFAYSFYPFTLIPYREAMLLVAASASVLASIGLFYILVTKLKNFCAVCVACWIVNFCILYLAVVEVGWI